MCFIYKKSGNVFHFNCSQLTINENHSPKMEATRHDQDTSSYTVPEKRRHNSVTTSKKNKKRIDFSIDNSEKVVNDINMKSHVGDRKRLKLNKNRKKGKKSA